ncbi:glycosyltransferase [Microbacterium sp. NPDC087592]|uniref:glycosyltransferase n=1 Tax=Microbacterium sp. NPDC087592 TaxID=3364193 RepID=UPI0038235050
MVDSTTEVGEKPTVLVLSFSPIRRDARVLKQVRLLEKDYRVVTCGYEAAPSDDVEHIEIPADARVDNPYGRFVSLRQYSLAYWRLTGVQWAREALAGRRFDVIIANDVQAVPLALALRPSDGVLADLHEYWPRLHEENSAWMRWISPYYRWMCRKYVRRADAVTTVSPGLAKEYEREFGFAPEVVTNATPFADLQPSAIGAPLRLVHSGAGLRNRDLGLMVDAVNRSTADVTLDLYLTPNHPDYLEELRRQAEESGRARLRDAVPYDELITTLNDYDMGVFVLPPVNFSYAHALPNKFFDFVQARLGVIVGPSPELGPTVDQYGLGKVTTDWGAEALAAAIDSLTPEEVREFKANAARAAHELSAEEAVGPWLRTVQRLVAGGLR